MLIDYLIFLSKKKKLKIEAIFIIKTEIFNRKLLYSLPLMVDDIFSTSPSPWQLVLVRRLLNDRQLLAGSF